MSRKVRHAPSTDPVNQVIDVVDPRSPSPEYFVDLTVDSPWPPRPRAPLRINRILRRHQCDPADQAAESSQIQTIEAPDLELIDHSNRYFFIFTTFLSVAMRHVEDAKDEFPLYFASFSS